MQKLIQTLNPIIIITNDLPSHLTIHVPAKAGFFHPMNK